MSNALDMSLDEIIKSNRKPMGSVPRGRGGGGRGPGSGSGGPAPSRRFSNRVGNRAAPYSRPVQAPDSLWQHDMFALDTTVAAAFGARVADGGSSIETGTKLYISNLDYGVSNEDIKKLIVITHNMGLCQGDLHVPEESRSGSSYVGFGTGLLCETLSNCGGVELFSEVGDLKRYGVHYDRSGRSKGTADVVFSRRNDALAAVKRYNNVQLDGKPMKIEIVGTNLSAPAPVPAPAPAPPLLPANGIFGNFNSAVAVARSRGRGRGSFMGRPRGGIGGGRGGRAGRGRGRGRGEKISAEDLDAELDKYHKEAMETS